MADTSISSTPAAASPTTTQPSEKLSFATKLAYGAGDLSPGIATIILSFFQLFFLSTVAGLNIGVAGTILLAAKVWDAISDPFMGWLSDRTRSRMGRRRPWLLYGAVPFGLVFFLQWLIPPFGEVGLIIYYVVMVVLMSTVFTIVAVPYTALTPELTQDYDERTTLNSFRFAFSIGGSLAGLILHQTIVGLFPDQQTGYLVAGLVMGIIFVPPFLWCFAGVRENHVVSVTENSLSIGKQIRLGLKNVPYLFVMGIYLCSWLAVQVTASVLPFYITFWLQEPDIQLAMIAAVQGSALVFLFVWNAISARIGKQAIFYIGGGVWIVVQALLFFLQPGQTTLAFVLAVVAGVGVAVAYLVPWSMLPDVMEYDELRTGQRREGFFYGFMVFAQKTGLGLGLFLVGQVLAFQGFNETLDVGQQPDSALLAIRFMIGPMPTVLLIIGMVLVRFYPITREKYREIQAELAARRASAEE